MTKRGIGLKIESGTRDSNPRLQPWQGLGGLTAHREVPDLGAIRNSTQTSECWIGVLPGHFAPSGRGASRGERRLPTAEQSRALAAVMPSGGQ